MASAEHIATYDRRADILERRPQHVVVCSRFTAIRVSMNRAKSL
jgi:hypothetical protein